MKKPSARKRRGRPPLKDVPDRVDTRLFLMQAASEIMIEKDGADVSLSEIAERSEMSPALVQYHFGNKEGLLIALIERDGAEGVAKLERVRQSDLPALDKLRLHIGGLVNAYFRAPYMNQLLNVLMRREETEASRRVSDLFMRPIVEFQRHLLEQGVREGTFREVSPVEFYFMLVGACDHLFARRGALAHVFDITEVSEDLKRDYIRFLTETISRGIAAD
ncbi:TetR family transcriptional regulator [Novosphingopyxis sp.]|uniref:TetR family transcriptional regulator n=1 Tax=Novosphingopyxis sp. TaxID=2709690 RepID=UPI003B5D0431